MKYRKPDLHFIGAASAVAKCVPGSNAASSFDCTSGIQNSTYECALGSGAFNTCDVGLGANNTCTPTGGSQGQLCVDGNNQF